MDVAQLVVVGLVGTIFCLLLKKQSPEFALFVSIATGFVLFFAILPRLSVVADLLSQMASAAGIGLTYANIVLKVIGIAYIAQFGAELCADAGEQAVASKIELAGKVLLLSVSAPVLFELMNFVLQLAS